MGANHDYTEVGLIYDAYLAHTKIGSLVEFTPDLLNEFYDVLDWERDENEAKHKKNLIKWLRRNKCDESEGARPRGGWAALVRDSCIGSKEKTCKQEAIPEVVSVVAPAPALAPAASSSPAASPSLVASPSGTMRSLRAEGSHASATSPNTSSASTRSSSSKAEAPAAAAPPRKQRKSPRNAHGGVLKYLKSPSAGSKASTSTSSSSTTTGAEKESPKTKILNLTLPDIKQQDLLMRKSLNEAYSAFGKGDFEETVAALSMALSLVSGGMKASRGTADGAGVDEGEDLWEECSGSGDCDMEL